MKIGIALLTDWLPTTLTLASDYCKKYCLDDVIFVGFKGTDKSMCCREFQYMLGYNQDYNIDKPLVLCHRGLHFCLELDSVFSYYGFYETVNRITSESNNRYFIALPEGRVVYGVVKSCSDSLNILEEIPHDMAKFYHEEIRYAARFSEAIVTSGLYRLVNYTVNKFIANNKDGNDYINIIPYSEGGGLK